MASPAYLTIVDSQGEKIQGGVEIQDRVGTAEIHAFNYDVSIPCDSSTGVLTGVRKHSDTVMVKQIDQASPLLFQACCDGSTMKEMTIDWYRIDDQGVEELYFSHQMFDVKVVCVKHFMLHIKNPNHDTLSHQEQVHIRFGKIKVLYHQGNLQATDEWNASRGRKTKH